MMFKILVKDNYDRENVDEYFIAKMPLLSEEQAKQICNILNKTPDQEKYYKAVPLDYIPYKFEP